jgi:hypothetical protein
MHRGVPEHGPAWVIARRIGLTVFFVVGGAVLFSVVFIIGSLLIHGYVNW